MTRALLSALLCATLPVLAVGAQSGKKATSPAATANEGKPVLLSRTGGAGGDSWADAKELQAAAAKGNPKAQAQLGEMLLRGDGMPKDEARAVDLFEQAARAGNGAAAFRLGMLFENGDAGVTRNPQHALDYFRAAAAGGEKEAFFNIGAAYASGKGVKRDYAEALGWLIVARLHGADASAENQLRERLKAQPDWLARGGRRAKEIEREFTGKKVADFLPPAPGNPAPTSTSDLKPTATIPSPAPAPLTPDRTLRPAVPAIETPKPDLPALPPPR